MEAIKALGTLDVGQSLGVLFLEVFKYLACVDPPLQALQKFLLVVLKHAKQVHQFAVDTPKVFKLGISPPPLGVVFPFVERFCRGLVGSAPFVRHLFFLLVGFLAGVV